MISFRRLGMMLCGALLAPAVGQGQSGAVAFVQLEQPARVGMPVWLKIDAPDAGSIRYPYILGPGWFGCNEVEVRRNGKMLPAVQDSNRMPNGGVAPGNACAGFAILGLNSPHTDRLPLHLIIHFDEPGTYEVRYTRRRASAFGGPPQTNFLARSKWTPIEILPAQPNQRAEFLKALRDRAPSDPAELLTDFLPNLLGFPDQASLEILVDYLYHPEHAVSLFAMNGLFYWPADSTSGRLREVVRTKGSSDFIDQYLRRTGKMIGVLLAAGCRGRTNSVLLGTTSNLHKSVSK